jgi:ABC-type Na+ efflux pump permease subunit
MALVLPFMITIAIPAYTGERLGDDIDLLRLSAIADPPSDLSTDARVQLFLFEQFLLLFLLTPITGAMALAAHSVVGEKQARTLEPLLATPIGTIELLVAKVLGSLLPTLAIAMSGLAVYVGGLAVFAEPGVLPAMLNGRTAVLVFIVGPAAALLSLQVAIVVSSRVNDARTAQQFGVLIIIPLTVLVVAQFAGMIWLSASALALMGAVVLVLWGLLTWLSAALFQRDAILTRWR